MADAQPVLSAITALLTALIASPVVLAVLKRRDDRKHVDNETLELAEKIARRTMVSQQIRLAWLEAWADDVEEWADQVAQALRDAGHPVPPKPRRPPLPTEMVEDDRG